MSLISLDELYRQSVTFPGPNLRMTGLQQVREAIEEQLEHLKDQHTIRLGARLEREARMMADEDIEHEQHKLKNMVDELFPKVLRGGFIVSLWSVFEACVKDLAEYTRREKELPFSLQELRAGNFLNQMDLFFSRTLNLTVFPDKDLRTRLDEIMNFRHALAHHDGSVDKLPNSLHCKNESEYKNKGLYVYKDLHHSYAVPSAEYTKESLDSVKKFLEHFSDQVYVALHPIPLEDNA
ncbi:MAG: hypothetical protein KGN35_01000 [Betaproteobacteria bacterium]|nr:hypothetical protein [Betaproteobacteria bacterium]